MDRDFDLKGRIIIIIIIPVGLLKCRFTAEHITKAAKIQNHISVNGLS